MGIFYSKRQRVPAERPVEMSFDEIIKLKNEVDKEIQGRAVMEMEAMKNTIHTTSAALGMTVQEMLGLATPPAEPTERKQRKKREARPKYQNPNDPTQQWSGRGKPPRWLQDLVDAGGETNQFLIDKPNSVA